MEPVADQAARGSQGPAIALFKYTRPMVVCDSLQSNRQRFTAEMRSIKLKISLSVASLLKRAASQATLETQPVSFSAEECCLEANRETCDVRAESHLLRKSVLSHEPRFVRPPSLMKTIL